MTTPPSDFQDEAVMWRTRGPMRGWMASDDPPTSWFNPEPLYPRSSIRLRDARILELETALTELVQDFRSKAAACAELFRSVTTVEDQMRMLGKQVTYNHAAELTELTILRLTSDLETKDPQS